MQETRQESDVAISTRTDQETTHDRVNHLITVASAVETFLQGYLKANPGHSLATVLCHELQVRLRAVEQSAG